MLPTLLPRRLASPSQLPRQLRQFSTTRPASHLRIGFVPEHFSTPLIFAKHNFSLDCTLLPFPSGTGHMVTSLQSGELDLAIGLTEGWVSGICTAQSTHRSPNFHLIGTYVQSPLRWAISTGASRSITSSDLQGKKVGVSRIGSGSYVMSYVLAHQNGWLDPNSSHPPFPVEVLQTFSRLREAVNEETADFFLWEYFTSKRYYDSGEIKHIGDIYSPWPSWMIVAADAMLWPHGRHHGARVLTEEVEGALEKINRGIQYFRENGEEAVRYISTKLDYTEEDARAWLPTVEFAEDVRGVRREDVVEAMRILGQAGVLEEKRYTEDVGNVVALFKE
ncbi:hypothetical protein M011DRAFT_480951 [Sporormia fimetaria CBS 119925]|uniref:Ca3427-like PBP 2 domain-containing protein n=1 Tax=Sporormia fimetaria CBS 119925 TaxID=1340428 RepID=A0A6A6V0J1_9PLEO|nr:hypothetical protein M011DRAFT_480951 [Sporormia fimetaria CBS 119925]